MTPTREEYTLAAKAAGVEILYWAYERPYLMDGARWEPLDDADDSQDLQVRIEANIKYWPRHVIVTKGCVGPISEHDGSLEDRKRALREAIFKLAVEIGKGME